MCRWDFVFVFKLTPSEQDRINEEDADAATACGGRHVSPSGGVGGGGGGARRPTANAVDDDNADGSSRLPDAQRDDAELLRRDDEPGPRAPTRAPSFFDVEDWRSFRRRLADTGLYTYCFLSVQRDELYMKVDSADETVGSTHGKFTRTGARSAIGVTHLHPQRDPFSLSRRPPARPHTTLPRATLPLLPPRQKVRVPSELLAAWAEYEPTPSTTRTRARMLKPVMVTIRARHAATHIHDATMRPRGARAS